MKKNPTKLKDAKAMLTVRADKTNITLEWIYWQASSQTQSVKVRAVSAPPYYSLL